MKHSMKRKMVGMGIIFLCILTGITVLFLLTFQTHSDTKKNRELVLALNEIEKLTEVNGKSPAKAQIATLEKSLLEKDTDTTNAKEPFLKIIIILYVSCVAFVLVLFGYLYKVILRPFEKLEHYAGEIGKGNMDVRLDYERTNFFGAFTWSFDHMRREINKARSCEKEAIENNKTVIATLSHDIKTPIASIRAYAEGLEANMDSSLERRQRYLSVLMKKCDEVTKLTNDLFLHSLSDLDKLQIQSEPMELSELILQTVEEMSGDQKDIIIRGTIDKKQINGDRKRLEQVLENIFNNARKYAPNTQITVWTETKEHGYEIHIKDQGNGICPEDTPFVFEKFYRGKNVEGKTGSGLGLYIVKYIMNQMNGEVLLQNSSNGLEVILSIREETVLGA